MKISHIDYNKLATLEWLQRWSGSYTFISCSHWGPEYYRSLKRVLGIGFRHTYFTHSKGTVSFYVPRLELDALGKYLAARVAQNPSLVKKYSVRIRNNTDILTRIMKKFMHVIPSEKEYWTFRKYFDPHLAYHGFIKETVDYLPESILMKTLPIFKNARVYSEHIYSLSETFFRSLAKMIGKKEGYSDTSITCLTRSECEIYFATGKLPGAALLASRYKGGSLYFDRNSETFFDAKQTSLFEQARIRALTRELGHLQGVAAFPGRVKARCRILLNPADHAKLRTGEVLITGMTRPEFLPAIKRASAIVTDSGGILSHAAIIAREMQIPCVVGTQIATKVLHTGKRIEVDAEKGIVRILN